MAETVAWELVVSPANMSLSFLVSLFFGLCWSVNVCCVSVIACICRCTFHNLLFFRFPLCLYVCLYLPLDLSQSVCLLDLCICLYGIGCPSKGFCFYFSRVSRWGIYLASTSSSLSVTFYLLCLIFSLCIPKRNSSSRHPFRSPFIIGLQVSSWPCIKQKEVNYVIYVCWRTCQRANCGICTECCCTTRKWIQFAARVSWRMANGLLCLGEC